jgi:hypothetical protein
MLLEKIVGLVLSIFVFDPESNLQDFSDTPYITNNIRKNFSQKAITYRGTAMKRCSPVILTGDGPPSVEAQKKNTRAPNKPRKQPLKL